MKLKIETSEDEDIKLRDPTIDTPIVVSDFEEMTIKKILPEHNQPLNELKV